jgi:hypothetical protein
MVLLCRVVCYVPDVLVLALLLLPAPDAAAVASLLPLPPL